MHATHIRHGSTHRSFCALVWIGSGLLLFLGQGGPASLLTMRALVFFAGGIVGSSLVLGTFGSWTHKVLAQAVLLALRPPGDAALGLTQIAGLAVLAAEIAGVYSLAVWVYAQDLAF